jgi:hypothetical protein
MLVVLEKAFFERFVKFALRYLQRPTQLTNVEHFIALVVLEGIDEIQ